MGSGMFGLQGVADADAPLRDGNEGAVVGDGL